MSDVMRQIPFSSTTGLHTQLAHIAERKAIYLPGISDAALTLQRFCYPVGTAFLLSTAIQGIARKCKLKYGYEFRGCINRRVLYVYIHGCVLLKSPI